MNIENILSQLINQKVTSCIVGGGAGSIIKMELDSNCYFFIYSSWRIECNGVVLSTSTDSNEAIIGRMAKAARLLQNNPIISIQVTDQYDLTIHCENKYCLKSFSDISYSQTEGDGTYDCNWGLYIPNQNICYEINNFFELKTEKYY